MGLILTRRGCGVIAEPRGDAVGLCWCRSDRNAALRGMLAGCEPARSSASNALTPLRPSPVANLKGANLGAEKKLDQMNRPRPLVSPLLPNPLLPPPCARHNPPEGQGSLPRGSEAKTDGKTNLGGSCCDPRHRVCVRWAGRGLRAGGHSRGPSRRSCYPLPLCCWWGRRAGDQLLATSRGLQPPAPGEEGAGLGGHPAPEPRGWPLGELRGLGAALPARPHGRSLRCHFSDPSAAFMFTSTLPNPSCSPCCSLLCGEWWGSGLRAGTPAPRSAPWLRAEPARLILPRC